MNILNVFYIFNIPYKHISFTKSELVTKFKSGKIGSRNGEPIFNVFDGLLADIESLRSTDLEDAWIDAADLNTPEAARARIAVDVKALRDEVCAVAKV